MGDGAVAEKRESSVSEQKMWPIFVTGFALMGFGFYFVFGQPSPDIGAEAAVAERVDSTPLEPLKSTVSEPLMLEYGSGERRYRLEMEQMAMRPHGASLRTTLTLDLHDSPAPPRADEEFAFLRSFKNVRVSVRKGNERVGEDVTNEVVRLLEATKLEVGFAKNGERLRSEVVSSESAQMRPTLDLLNDATQLLFPPTPVEPVNVSESWSIRIPAELQGTDIVEVEGATDVKSTLSAATKSEARLDAEFTGDIRTTWDDAEERRGHLETVISGNGGWLWDRSLGRPKVAKATLERKTLEPDGEKLESATIVVSATEL
jgi:hypothetical protein